MPLARQPASNSIGARPTPFIKTASAATQQRINEVLGADGVERRRMLLVSTTGPTSFVVADCPGDEGEGEESRFPRRVERAFEAACEAEDNANGLFWMPEPGPHGERFVLRVKTAAEKVAENRSKAAAEERERAKAK